MNKILVVGIIVIMLSVGSIFYYYIIDAPTNSSPTPTATIKPQATSTAPQKLTDVQKKAAWEDFKRNPQAGCRKLAEGEVTPETKAVRFSKAMEREKVEIPVEKEEVYECMEQLWVY